MVFNKELMKVTDKQIAIHDPKIDLDILMGDNHGFGGSFWEYILLPMVNAQKSQSQPQDIVKL